MRMRMRMRMTNDNDDDNDNDNDNDSSNVNETIQTFFYFTKRFYKHKSSSIYEVKTTVLNFLFFKKKNISYAQKSQKTQKARKKHKNAYKLTETKKTAFLCA